MSRTNHAKREYEARAAREAEEYRQRIAARDANRKLREQVRELDRWIEWPVRSVELAHVSFALATLS